MKKKLTKMQRVKELTGIEKAKIDRRLHALEWEVKILTSILGQVKDIIGKYLAKEK